jgi:hypothetical protein
VGSHGDGPPCPRRDGAVGRDDEDGRRAAVAGRHVDRVEGPAAPLLGVAAQLHLDDEREDDALTAREQEDEVGAGLDGRDRAARLGRRSPERRGGPGRRARCGGDRPRAAGAGGAARPAARGSAKARSMSVGRDGMSPARTGHGMSFTKFAGLSLGPSTRRRGGRRADSATPRGGAMLGSSDSRVPTRARRRFDAAPTPWSSGRSAGRTCAHRPDLLRIARCPLLGACS